MTGLAWTYLTVVHTDDELQEIRYALNTRDDFELPEGMFVPWEDTLCKRARDEDRPCTTDVPAVRGDHDAARSLGLQVYISVPVETPDGKREYAAAQAVFAADKAMYGVKRSPLRPTAVEPSLTW